jgi:hypothetical protein
VVLDLDRKALVVRIERGTARHGPGLEDAGSDVLAKSRLARYFAELALAICSCALAQRGGRTSRSRYQILYTSWPSR